MSNLNLKENVMLRDIIVRSALVIATVAIVVWALPHDKNTIFHVEEGKPWKYVDITAPFDFPVYKSDKVVKQERDSVLRQYEPYYKYNEEKGPQMLKKFTKDYADGIPDVPDYFVTLICNRLEAIYDQGIMDTKEYDELLIDTTALIRIVSKKQAISQSVKNIYSTKKAYEQLFTDHQLSALRQQLQKCNLNNYIVPNLTYDRERSETSKNDLITSIPLASGLIQQGEKIVNQGEIVTERTKRIIDSYIRENDRRNQDKTRNQISLMGQILYVSILMICFTVYLSLYRKDYFEKPRSITMLYALIVIFTLLTALLVRNTFVHVYILPYAMVPIFIRVFMDSRTAFMTHVIMILICALMLQHPFEFIVLEIVAGLAAISSLRELSQRSQLFKTAIFIT